ncbi:MAG: hypothetical protein AAFX56_16265, partial [Pseudomonadota bacterium]
DIGVFLGRKAMYTYSLPEYVCSPLPADSAVHKMPGIHNKFRPSGGKPNGPAQAQIRGQWTAYVFIA